ncbi:MAG: hypothetical protein R6V01_03870 [Thermoplasmatota archaeon]
MTCHLKEIRKRYRFKPYFNYEDAKSLFNHAGLIKSVRNDRLHSLIKGVTDLLMPREQGEEDILWNGLYFPTRKNGKLVLIPASVRSYKQMFGLFPHGLSYFEFESGNMPINEELETMLSEIKQMMILIKQNGMGGFRGCVPYELRKGRIMGRHIFPELLPGEEKNELLSLYHDRESRISCRDGISLFDYLFTASVCYEAAFGESASGSDPLERYKRWADGRDEGMLDIEDPESKEQFAEWINTRSRGGHPFEIVFSWSEHGIHLYPPGVCSKEFILSYTNKFYMETAVKMAKGMIDKGIPFRFDQMEEAVSYMAGDTYIDVNSGGLYGFRYNHSEEMRKRYFDHIEWEPLDIPVFK